MARKWLPTDYQDEMIPELRASPDDWIVNGGSVAGMWEDDEPTPVAEGEVVKFDWCEHLGRAKLVVSHDGTWTCDCPIPKAPYGSEFHVMAVGDPAAMNVDMEDFITELDPGEYDIRFYAWSCNPVPHEFKAGRFIPLAST